MNIGKVPTVQTGGNSAQVTKKQETAKGKTSDGNESPKRGRTTDRVVISKDALARLAAMADAARADGITEAAPPADEGIRIEKVRLARERVRSGYYDRPEIQEQIADRLADELRTHPPDNTEEPEQK